MTASPKNQSAWQYVLGHFRLRGSLSATPRQLYLLTGPQLNTRIATKAQLNHQPIWQSPT